MDNAWPALLENRLNDSNFPYSSGGKLIRQQQLQHHEVTNMVMPGCLAKCQLVLWPETYETYLSSNSDEDEGKLLGPGCD